MAQPRYKTYATGPAKLVDRPDQQLFKAGAAALEDRFGFELKPQVDLMYVQSCLVTVGINDNDDVFLADELWKARQSPILKPFNWQHTDKDILGVMYGVAARDLHGNAVAFDQDAPPSAGYELITETAVYKLIHDQRAKEIQRRSANGTLYVSMEAWFDNYDYCVINDDGGLEIIRRTESTAWMDKHLRACGGNGKYDNRRVGRVLRNVTFGGCGFVDVPANKRSDILEVEDFIPHPVPEDPVVSLLRKIEQDPVNSWTASDPVVAATDSHPKERELMSAEAKTPADDHTKIARESAEAALAVEREARAKAEAEEAQKALAKKAEELSSENSNLKAEADKNQGELTQATERITELEKELAAKHEALDSVIETLAGATSDTSPEIAKLDSVTDGNSLFQAKISWIEESAKATATKATRVDALEEDLATAAAAVRESDIRETFAADVFEEDEIEAYVKAGLSLSDDEYELWLAQNKLILSKIEVAEAAEDKKVPDFLKKKDKKGKKDMDKAESKDQQQLFEELLRRAGERRAQSKQAQLQPESLGIDSGVAPAPLHNPRHRLVKGGRRPDQVLDGASEVSSPNLAGAEGASADSKPVNPARTLATELYKGVHGSDESSHGAE